MFPMVDIDLLMLRSFSNPEEPARVVESLTAEGASYLAGVVVPINDEMRTACALD
jgi:hypothetical protein